MLSPETLEALNRSVAAYDLLQHPFYQAWSDGTLPVSSLATYAREYGAFIRNLPAGWRTLGNEAYAKVEEAHAVLWDKFAHALTTQVNASPEVPEVAELVRVARASFATEAETLGALYAFEVQQPKTAASKLEGLQTHYASLPTDVRPYFKAHENDDDERREIVARLGTLSAADQALAQAACERMSKALWDALTGIHGDHACVKPN